MAVRAVESVCRCSRAACRDGRLSVRAVRAVRAVRVVVVVVVAARATAGVGWQLWDAKTGEVRRTLEGPGDVEWLRWHPKGNVVLAGSQDGTIWMWLALTGACMQVARVAAGRLSRRARPRRRRGGRELEFATFLSLLLLGLVFSVVVACFVVVRTTPARSCAMVVAPPSLRDGRERR